MQNNKIGNILNLMEFATANRYLSTRRESIFSIDIKDQRYWHLEVSEIQFINHKIQLWRILQPI